MQQCTYIDISVMKNLWYKQQPRRLKESIIHIHICESRYIIFLNNLNRNGIILIALRWNWKSYWQVNENFLMWLVNTAEATSWKYIYWYHQLYQKVDASKFKMSTSTTSRCKIFYRPVDKLSLSSGPSRNERKNKIFFGFFIIQNNLYLLLVKKCCADDSAGRSFP